MSTWVAGIIGGCMDGHVHGWMSTWVYGTVGTGVTQVKRSVKDEIVFC